MGGGGGGCGSLSKAKLAKPPLGFRSSRAGCPAFQGASRRAREPGGACVPCRQLGPSAPADRVHAQKRERARQERSQGFKPAGQAPRRARRRGRCRRGGRRNPSLRLRGGRIGPGRGRVFRLGQVWGRAGRRWGPRGRGEMPRKAPPSSAQAAAPVQGRAVRARVRPRASPPGAAGPRTGFWAAAGPAAARSAAARASASAGEGISAASEELRGPLGLTLACGGARLQLDTERKMKNDRDLRAFMRAQSDQLPRVNSTGARVWAIGGGDRD